MQPHHQALAVKLIAAMVNEHGFPMYHINVAHAFVRTVLKHNIYTRFFLMVVVDFQRTSSALKNNLTTLKKAGEQRFGRLAYYTVIDCGMGAAKE